MPKKASNETQDHEFWSTQPVSLTDNVDKIGAFEQKQVSEIRTEPYDIASVLEWFEPDVTNEKDMDALYNLLLENYVEDDDGVFRFGYPKEFLRWVLTPPGYFKEWHIGIRKKADKKMLAFISGVPCGIRVGDKFMPQLCEINFLCIHKVLRAKRLAPILIKEVTRRVNLRDIWQAVYTAGVPITRPFTTAQYWHRSLNPQKLCDIGFSAIPSKFKRFAKPMDALKRALAVPGKITSALRPMQPEDVPAVHALMTSNLSKFKVAPQFSQDDVTHWLLPRKFLHTYVIDGPEKTITDSISFYALPSKVLGNAEHDELRATYLYYYAHSTMSFKALLGDALVLARDLGFDVFNMLDIMENGEVKEELKFNAGDGYLRYYFYNWNYPIIKPQECGLVLM